MLCEPWVQLNCSENWCVLSFWYQLVPPLPKPLNPVMLKSGMPGLLYVESPLKPGIPRSVPARVQSVDGEGFRASELKKFRPTRKSFTSVRRQACGYSRWCSCVTSVGTVVRVDRDCIAAERVPFLPVRADVEPDVVADILIDAVQRLVIAAAVLGTATEKLLARPGRFGAG